MVPYTAGKVPSTASCIVDDYTAVGTLSDISGYMNVQRNKGDHPGVGISATARNHDLCGARGPRVETSQACSFSCHFATRRIWLCISSRTMSPYPPHPPSISPHN